ncbi:ATP-binding protein [Kandleria sp.]|uniref:ATP-binding protein n=1 Tax=Kandleria sp. TaxID=2774291 RepID=UPI001B4FB27B|nr:ATP-binding protein [Kandleria sp.]MBP3275277.1 ATP-binding protein [Kandleria sp.]
MKLNDLIVYDRISDDQDVLYVLKSIEHLHHEDIQHEFMTHMLRLAERYDLHDHLMQGLITYLLAMHENAFTLSLERNVTVEDNLKYLVIEDLHYFFDLMHESYQELAEGSLNLLKNYKHSRPIINKEIYELLSDLQEKLAQSKSVEEFYEILYNHYMHYGVGKYGLNKAFRYRDDKIVSIDHIDDHTLEQLIGYERQKKKLIANTEAFINGKKANNVLLYGDNGTGKSSSVKALLNRYYKQGLRMVEVYKHQFIQLPQIIGELQNRHYKFIIFMDDLSFEEFETEYKYLKAVIEGGLEKKPDNILIYATSNRRHLIKETWEDREGSEININDAKQEKLSLVARFGVQILYTHPNKKEYLEIVDGLAKEHGLNVDEKELHRLAMEWELRNGGYSGRTAKQFINMMLGQ